MKKKHIITVAKYFSIILITIITLTPILWTFLSTIRPWSKVLGGSFFPSLSEITLSNYIEVFREGRIFMYIKNSLMYGIFSALISTVLGVLAGYGLSRFNLPGRKAILTSFVFIMMIPVLVVLVPIYFILVKMNFLSRTALILIYAAGNIPLCVWLNKTYIDTIPKELDEAACIDGCTKLRNLWSIILPMATPGYISAFIITFVNGWNELIYAVTLLDRIDYRPITSGILSTMGQYGNQWAKLNTAAMIACLPVLVIFFLLQRYFIGGLVAGAVKE